MSWHRRYHLKEIVRSSFWLYPSLAFLIAWFTAKTILWIIPDPHWPRFVEAEMDSVQASMAALASSMLTFIVYAVSALLLAARLASGQTTPRLIQLTFGRWEMKAATSIFVFAFGITLVALANLTGQTRHAALIVLAIISNLAAILAFFWFIQEVALGLRPVALLQRVFDEAMPALDTVYTGTFQSGAAPREAPKQLTESEGRLLRRIGSSGALLAFGRQDLAALAATKNCVIELIPQIGDFVTVGDPLARVYPASAAIEEAELDGLVAFGPERTMRQDPMFALRIMVDVATRALSPAVNDPTTAVLAIDQIHRFLRYAGRKNLDTADVRDAAGEVRLVYPTPEWQDIVDLALTEIRHYGATSLQVVRRLRAMLEHLIERLPPERAPALRREIALLDLAVARCFPDEIDRRRASVGDVQGLGGSSLRADL